jgi:hypothetical protein
MPLIMPVINPAIAPIFQLCIFFNHLTGFL